MTTTMTPTVTIEQIDAAQIELNDVIEKAKRSGRYSPMSSPAWAQQLGYVATLRRAYAKQQEKR